MSCGPNENLVPDEFVDVGVFVCKHVAEGATVKFIASGTVGLTALCGADVHFNELDRNEDYTWIHLTHIVDNDPSTHILVDMPIRLCTKREGKNAVWEFDEDGDDDEDEEPNVDEHLYGLSRAEIGDVLAPLHEGGLLYRAESKSGAWLIIRQFSGLPAIPVWDDAGRAAEFVAARSPSDGVVAMSASDIILFIENFPADLRYILFNPGGADLVKMAEVGMAKSVWLSRVQGLGGD